MKVRFSHIFGAIDTPILDFWQKLVLFALGRKACANCHMLCKERVPFLFGGNFTIQLTQIRVKYSSTI